MAEQQESFFVEEQNLRFQGQYLDRETGLHYNTFRFYGPDIGRFISPDPIGLAGGINLFQYAPEPFGWVDPWGLKTWTYQNMKSLEGFQKHHIIPQSLENHPALKNADFKMHSNRNIIYLPTNETAHPTRTIHKGSHPGYNKSVRQQLDIIARVGEKNGWVEADYKKAVSGVLRNERAGLRNGRTMLNKNSIRAVRCGG